MLPADSDYYLSDSSSTPLLPKDAPEVAGWRYLQSLQGTGSALYARLAELRCPRRQSSHDVREKYISSATATTSCADAPPQTREKAPASTPVSPPRKQHCPNKKAQLMKKVMLRGLRQELEEANQQLESAKQDLADSFVKWRVAQLAIEAPNHIVRVTPPTVAHYHMGDSRLNSARY